MLLARRPRPVRPRPRPPRPAWPFAVAAPLAAVTALALGPATIGGGGQAPPPVAPARCGLACPGAPTF